MKQLFTILCVFAISAIDAQNELGGIGQWRGHFDNHSIIKVIKGDEIYAASPYQIIKIKGSSPVNWMDKSTGLHDVNINNLEWDNNQEQLIITYSNSNIDIVKGDEIFNINAIQLTNLYSFKKINSILVQQNLCFLSTQFGIVVVDLIKHEIKDTWYPNNNQQPINTNNIVIANNTLYANTENGIWSCPLLNNLVQNNRWTHHLNLDALNIKKWLWKNQNLYGYNNNYLYKIPEGNKLLEIKNGMIQQIDTGLNNIFLAIQYLSKKGALLELNKDFTTTTIIDSNQLVAPMNAVMENNQFWVADSTMGLLQKGTTIQWLNVGGPNGVINGYLSISENNLLAPFGLAKKGFAQFKDNQWTSFSKIGNLTLPNLNASQMAAKDDRYWLASNTELYHLSNANTQIETVYPNKFTGAYKNIQIDQNQNIWGTQDQQGIIRQVNNNWNLIPPPVNFNSNGLDKFIVNKQQQAWLIAPNNQGVYVYQSKDIYGTETWKQLTTSQTAGNLPSNMVTSIVSDKMESIWVGTDNGIAIFNCGDMTTQPCNAYLPIVKTNGFNGYLFQKEMVNTIAIDGANRKWVGTQNGAWLLSEDGLEIVEHFTKNNSPLPSDSILQILIDPNTGEVYFNTKNQMVSYRGTATEGAKVQQNINIFPNPVPPNFNGLIAFKGLIEDATLKITDLTGRLIYQTKSLGGQAVWNARTYEGNQVATGIYLVFVRDANGSERGVGKIVIAEGY